MRLVDATLEKTNKISYLNSSSETYWIPATSYRNSTYSVLPWNSRELAQFPATKAWNIVSLHWPH